MSARSFTVPLITVRDGQAQLPPEPGVDPTPQYAEPQKVAKAWIRQGARRLYIVDADAGANHGAIAAAISSSHGHAQVEFESGAMTVDEVDRALATGCHHTVINATDDVLAAAVKQNRKRIAVKVGVHETAFSTHATARDGSDLWDLLERLEDMGVYQYVLLNTTQHGHWRHKGLKLMEAALETVKAPVLAYSGVTRLEDLHALVAMSSDGLEGCAVDEGLYSGAFTLAEAEAAVEPRYDPYIWAPPDPMNPQVTDEEDADPSAPPISAL